MTTTRQGSDKIHDLTCPTSSVTAKHALNNQKQYRPILLENIKKNKSLSLENSLILGDSFDVFDTEEDEDEDSRGYE